MATDCWCIQCKAEDRETTARQESHFCSDECRAAYMVDKDGPVECANCDHGCETTDEAEALGWEDVRPDPEGRSWNFLGTCPQCQLEALQAESYDPNEGQDEPEPPASPRPPREEDIPY